MKKLLILSAALLFLSACQTGIKQMGATEYGVVFRTLPPEIGGGVSDKVAFPGQMVVVWPWDTVYAFDTSVQEITWGATEREGEEGHKRAQKVSEASMLSMSNSMQSAQQMAVGGQSAAGPVSAGYVNSRALDGNEVALGVTVRYKISTDPNRIANMVRQAVTTNEEVRELVVAVARSDIRTFMNKLRTSEFLDDQQRYRAVDQARESMASRLAPYGIDINGVILNEYRFERVLQDGSIDSSYGDRLKQIQRLSEDTAREKSRIETIRAKKQQEFNEAQGRVNRVVAEAQGVKDQARSRGESYLTARQNDSRGIRAKGEAEVKGMIEQINALSGPGGQELLKLEIAKQLSENGARFVLMDQGTGGQSVDVRKVDANELISQIGLIEAMKEKKAPVAAQPQAGAIAPSQIQPTPVQEQ